MTPGATRRRETTETVRDRISTLFPADDGWGGEAQTAPDPPEPPAAAPSPEVDAEWEPSPPPPPPPRSGLGLHPGLFLDRRALVGLTVLLLLAVGYAVQHFWLGRPQEVHVPLLASGSPSVASSPSLPHSAQAPPGAEVVVDVAGKVQHPGLRSLPNGARVADALRVAGGPLPDTDTDSLNLARVLTDGEQIVVGGPAAPPGPASPSAPLSLNHATVEQLDTLPGVGPALAQRIATFRRQHGGFSTLDQLRQVSGIGERKFLDLRSLLTL